MFVIESADSVGVFNLVCAGDDTELIARLLLPFTDRLWPTFFRVLSGEPFLFLEDLFILEDALDLSADLFPDLWSFRVFIGNFVLADIVGSTPFLKIESSDSLIVDAPLAFPDVDFL